MKFSTRRKLCLLGFSSLLFSCVPANRSTAQQAAPVGTARSASGCFYVTVENKKLFLSIIKENMLRELSSISSNKDSELDSKSNALRRIRDRFLIQSDNGRSLSQVWQSFAVDMFRVIETAELKIQPSRADSGTVSYLTDARWREKLTVNDILTFLDVADRMIKTDLLIKADGLDLSAKTFFLAITETIKKEKNRDVQSSDWVFISDDFFSSLRLKYSVLPATCSFGS